MILVLIPCTYHTRLSVDNSIVYWIPHSTHHTWSRDNSNCRQSVSSVVWGIFPCRPQWRLIWYRYSASYDRIGLLQSSHIHSYPFIPNIRIIGLILPARKNSKIAITRSCHLVLVQSANIYGYSSHTYPYRLYEFLRTGYVQLRTLNCIYDFWYRIHTACTVQSVMEKLRSCIFPQLFFHSNQPLHYQLITSIMNIPVRYCCLISAVHYIHWLKYIIVSFGAQAEKLCVQSYHYHTPGLFHTSALRFEANY